MMKGSDRNSTTATKGGERTDDERPAHVVVAWVAPHVREGVEPPADAAALGDGGGVDGLVLHGARRFRHWKAAGSTQRNGGGKHRGKAVENAKESVGKRKERRRKTHGKAVDTTKERQ